MPLLPISLGVRRKPDAGGAAFKSRSKLKSAMEKALRRDDYSCRCCGFHSEKFQRVVPAGNFSGTTDEFITLCSFCEQCFSLERTGLSGSGFLIWLPEISQADLHHIMRAIYVARASDHPLGKAAGQAFDALMARRTEAKKRLGSDDPLLLATVLYENLTDAEYAKSAAKLEGIRLLPLDRLLVRGSRGDANQFPQMVAYWTSEEGPFASLPVDSWGPLFESVISKAASTH